MMLISRRAKISKYLTKENKLIFVMGLSLLIAIFIISWANDKTPDYRPLVQDMRLVDAVKISDVLDQSQINYYADIKSHMLYVDQEQTELARISLAKIGIVIDYPEISKHENLNKAYDELLQSINKNELHVPIWQQPWFFKMQKLLVGALVVIVLILSIVRPALREIILDDDEK